MDYLAHFFLKFGHITVIFPIIVASMIFEKRNIIAKAGCCLLWVMIFNTLLKYLFKVPLFPHLGHGYAFPSGHMHAASAFYGYILYKSDNKFLKIVLSLLLCCLGLSLIYCRFHDLKDVLGAVGFTAFELTAYHLISTKFGDKTVGILCILTSVLTMIALSFVHKVEFHVWLAFYALVGMESALYISPEKNFSSTRQKFLALLVSLVAITGVYYLFKALAFDKFYLSEIRFALVPLIIVGTIRISKRLKI